MRGTGGRKRLLASPSDQRRRRMRTEAGQSFILLKLFNGVCVNTIIDLGPYFNGLKWDVQVALWVDLWHCKRQYVFAVRCFQMHCFKSTTSYRCISCSLTNVIIYPKTRFCFGRLGYTLLKFNIVIVIILTHGILLQCSFMQSLWNFFSTIHMLLFICSLTHMNNL